MSQQGSDLPQESPDQATAHHDGTSAGVGSATMRLAGSNSSSVCKLVASEPHNPESVPVAGPTMPHDGEDNARSKIANLEVPHVGEDNNAGSKISGGEVLHAGDDKNTGSKLAIQEVPHAAEGNIAGSNPDGLAVHHANEDNNTVSDLAIKAVLHAGEDNNARSKHGSPGASSERNAKERKNDLVKEEGAWGVATAVNSDGAQFKATKRSTSNACKKSTINLLVGGGGAHNTVMDAPMAITGSGRGNGKGKGAVLAGSEQGLHIWTERERRKKMKNMFSSLHALLPQLPNKADKASIVEEAITYIQTLEGTVQKLEQLKLERKRAQEAQQHQVGAGGSSSAAAPAPAPALHPTLAPGPAPASREAILADTVRVWNAQPADVAAAKAAAAAPGAGGSSAAAPVPPFQTWSGPNIVVSLDGNDGYIKLRAPRQQGILTKVLFALERHGIDVVTTTISAEGGHKSFIIHARINATSDHFAENLTTEDRFKMAVSEMLHLISN